MSFLTDIQKFLDPPLDVEVSEKHHFIDALIITFNYPNLLLVILYSKHVNIDNLDFFC